MKRHLTAGTLVLVLSGCIQSLSASYLPVGQAALTAVGMSEEAAVARVEVIVLANGLKKEPGVLISQTGGPRKERWYEDAHGNYASIAVSTQGCVSFLTYVRTGSNDLAAARSIWHEVVDSISKDPSWTIERDQVCTPAS